MFYMNILFNSFPRQKIPLVSVLRYDVDVLNCFVETTFQCFLSFSWWPNSHELVLYS